MRRNDEAERGEDGKCVALSKDTIERCRTLKDLTLQDINDIQEAFSTGSNWVLPALCENLRRTKERLREAELFIDELSEAAENTSP